VWSRFGELLPQRTRVSLLITGLGVLMLWIKALAEHHRMRKLYLAGLLPGSQEEYLIQRVVQTAINALHLGLTYTFFLSCMLVLQIAEVAKLITK
jgi:hypothetical protein